MRTRCSSRNLLVHHANLRCALVQEDAAVVSASGGKPALYTSSRARSWSPDPAASGSAPAWDMARPFSPSPFSPVRCVVVDMLRGMPEMPSWVSVGARVVVGGAPGAAGADAPLGWWRGMGSAVGSNPKCYYVFSTRGGRALVHTPPFTDLYKGYAATARCLSCCLSCCGSRSPTLANV